MSKFLIFLSCFILSVSMSLAVPVQGGIEKEILVGKSKVIDARTGNAISGARVSMPLENSFALTNEDGVFVLNANLNGQTVLLVEKEGYKPYSITVDKNDLASPLILGLEKATTKDITIEADLFHLGDNNYSSTSANAREFKVPTMGPYFSKNVKIGNLLPGTKVSLVIGSVMGIDTKMARAMGQNKIVNAYSSPPEIYFNGSKIAELQLNGDGQRIKIPNSLVRANKENQVTIKTGRNLMQTAYVDYDDIEIANISIETN